MYFDESTPDPTPFTGEDQSAVEEIPMEDIMSFMNRIKDEDTSAPESNEEPNLLNMFNEAKGIIEAAMAMCEAGPDAETPLAQLLSNDIVASSLVGIMMAPQFSDFEKIRMLGAVIIVSSKEYGISL